MTNWQAIHGDYFHGDRVLITGGAGFIGSHLAEALVQLGASVSILDDLSGGSLDNLRDIGQGRFPVNFIEGSINDAALVARSLDGCQYVFHQAAMGSVPRSIEQPERYNQVNTTGTLTVLEAARRARVQRIIFAASSSAYGDNPVPWIETMPARPRSPYAATKGGRREQLSHAAAPAMTSRQFHFGISTSSARDKIPTAPMLQ